MEIRHCGSFSQFTTGWKLDGTSGRPPARWPDTSVPGGLTPVTPGGPPLDPAALDATSRSFVQVHRVLHDGRKLGLDLRRTDTLLKESWLQHKQPISHRLR